MSPHWPGEYSDDIELPPTARFALYLASLGRREWSLVTLWHVNHGYNLPNLCLGETYAKHLILPHLRLFF